MEKKRKTLTNLFVGVFSQVIVLLLGFVVPRIVLVNYGSDTNGLTNTISQIFTYMALLEAGISVSARNAFYKSVKMQDKEGISFVASLAKKYYKRLSRYYFGAVIIISAIMPLLLKTSVPYTTVCFYIFFEGLTAVVSFYFVNTWTTFLRSNGEAYIINIFTLISKVLSYGVKIVLSLFSINIAFIQIGYFLVSLIRLALYYAYMKRKYNWIKYNVETGTAKLPDKNANLISEIASVVFSSTDMIVLSIFVSTSLSSVYSIYNMAFLALHHLLMSVYTSVNYHLGLEYNSGNINDYIKVHDFYMSAFVGSMTAMMSVCYCLIIPFVRLYTKGVNDIHYIYNNLPILFCLVYVLSWSRYVTGNLIGISFRQKPAVKVNVAEALINLSLSILLVNLMGIEGVLLATVIALPLKVIYCTYISDIVILKRSPIKTISILGVNYLLFFGCVFIKYFYELSIPNYYTFAGYGILITLIVGVIFLFVNMIVNKDIYRGIKKFMRI